VARLIAACDGTDPGRLRDRAIVLMSARLELRAGDVTHLRLTDIDWNNGTLRHQHRSRIALRIPPEHGYQRQFVFQQ
jgi:integrase